MENYPPFNVIKNSNYLNLHLFSSIPFYRLHKILAYNSRHGMSFEYHCTGTLNILKNLDV